MSDGYRHGHGTLMELARAAIAYDDAIRSCANDPDKMSSYCSAEGDDLDALYFRWMELARRTLDEPASTPGAAASIQGGTDELHAFGCPCETCRKRYFQDRISALAAPVRDMQPEGDLLDVSREFRKLQESGCDGWSHEDGWTLMATEHVNALRNDALAYRASQAPTVQPCPAAAATRGNERERDAVARLIRAVKTYRDVHCYPGGMAGESVKATNELNDAIAEAERGEAGK